MRPRRPPSARRTLGWLAFWILLIGAGATALLQYSGWIPDPHTPVRVTILATIVLAGLCAISASADGQ